MAKRTNTMPQDDTLPELPPTSNVVGTTESEQSIETPSKDDTPLNDEETASTDGLAAVLPAAPARPGYRQRHADVRLTHRQSEGFARLTAALDNAQARLDNGQRVTTLVHAIKWIGEHVPEPAVEPTA